MTISREVTDSTFAAEVLESPLPTLVDFWADWCAPCKRLEPILDQLASENDGALRVVKLDVDANPDTPVRYGVSGLPTLLLFKGGQVVETVVGFVPKDKLAARILPKLA